MESKKIGNPLEISSSPSKKYVYKKKSIFKRDILSLKEEPNSKFTDDDLEKLISQIQQSKEEQDKGLALSNRSRTGSLFIGKDECPKEEIGHYLFERNNLIMKILNLCKEKFFKAGEEYLAKAVNWIILEIQDSLIFKSDDKVFRIIEKTKEGNKDLQDIFNWLEEFSSMKDKNFSLEKVGNRKQSDNLGLSVIDETFSFMDISKKISTSSFSLDIYEENISKIEEPNFNIFSLEKEIGTENVLVTISCYIFITLGLYSQINYTKFEKALSEISKGYVKKNPYHNDIHAADIEQTIFMYLKYGKIAEILNLNSIDLSALFISAIIHDYKHPGFTNQYLINSNNEIAITFNGKF